jgi:hypothetical protein
MDSFDEIIDFVKFIVDTLRFSIGVWFFYYRLLLAAWDTFRNHIKISCELYLSLFLFFKIMAVSMMIFN